MKTAAEKSNGVFIVFEGGDSAGKSTQMKKLNEALTSLGYAPVVTREPGGTGLAEKIRELLLTFAAGDCLIDPTTEALLFAAARSAHIRNFVCPQLKAGKIVISDRYVDSSIAYQGAGRNLSIDDVTVINQIATDGLIPDLTILLDIKVAEARKRQSDRCSVRQNPDRIEAEPDQFHERARRAFLDQAEQFPEIYLVLDATEPVDFLAAHIMEHVKDLLPPPERPTPERTLLNRKP